MLTKKAFLMENEKREKRFMLFMFADAMAKDQADAIEKRRAKLFLCASRLN
jgi:hypothetical protein